MVAEAGWTVAAGVAKAHADTILIMGTMVGRSITAEFDKLLEAHGTWGSLRLIRYSC